jgi:hypothetical protein
MVLDFKWTGEYTMPGPRLYPHQWSWDSALIAIGYSRYDQDRAVRELSHLFESQWTSGLLPQIVINPLFGEYFPGMKFWHAEGTRPRRRSHGPWTCPCLISHLDEFFGFDAQGLRSLRMVLENEWPRGW